MATNGSTKIEAKDITERALIEILLEAVQQLTEKVEELTEQQIELVEKVANISTPGGDYGTLDEELVDFDG